MPSICRYMLSVGVKSHYIAPHDSFDKLTPMSFFIAYVQSEESCVTH